MATHPTSDRLGRARRQVAELRSTVTRTNPVCSSCSSTHKSTKHRRQFKRLNSTLRGRCVRHTHSRRARDGGEKVLVTSAPPGWSAWNRSGLRKAPWGEKEKNHEHANKTGHCEEDADTTCSASTIRARTRIARGKKINPSQNCPSNGTLNKNKYRKQYSISQWQVPSCRRAVDEDPFIHTSRTTAEARRVVAT